MKVFLPIKMRATGGTSTFAKKLQAGLNGNKDTVSFSFSPDYDVLLVLVSCPLRYLIHAKIHNKPIIHRLDGTYYPSTVAGKLYYLYNLPAKIIHRYFSTYTVYQSKYSKYCCDIFLGKRNDTRWRIVYNGVDTSRFIPSAWKTTPDTQVFVTVSRFRREDQIIPIIKALDIYAKTYTKNFYCDIVGDFSQSIAHIPQTYKDVPYLRFHQVISNDRLSRHLQSAHVFLYTHQNPPCPNTIIEAMACGLPICGVADGAMTEITKPGVNSELIPAHGHAFYEKRQLDLTAFADNIYKIMNNQPSYRLNSREIAEERFRIEPMIRQYVEVFHAVTAIK